MTSAMPIANPGPRETTDGNELHVLPGGRPNEDFKQGEGAEPTNSGLNKHHPDTYQRNDADTMSPEERSHLWSDLKAKTGYSSYNQYMMDGYKEDEDPLGAEAYRLYASFRELFEYSSSASKFRAKTPTCAILDLSSSKDSQPSISLHCCTSSASVLLAALRQQSTRVAVRIVLWRTSDFNERMVNAIGLALGVHYRFFHTLFSMSGRLSHVAREKDRYMHDRKRLAPDFIAIGDAVVSIPRQYHSLYPEATLVVLIASEKFSVPNNKLHMYVDEHFGSSSPTPGSLSAPRDKIPQWISAYSRILLETERDPSMRYSADLLLRPLVPMLCFNMFSIREKCDWRRENYDQSNTHLESFRSATRLEDLFKWRNDLRRTVEKSEDTLDQIPRFLNSARILSLQRRKKPSEQLWIGNEIKKVHLEAHRLETELRDYLQLQTGVVAIDESRKSIQLSNLQIEEGKRGKFNCPEQQWLLAKQYSQ